MKKGFTFLFLLALLASTYYGLKNHFGMISHLQTKQEAAPTVRELEGIHPILEDQKIVAIVFAENNEEAIERTMISLFNQTYLHMRIIFVDNGSSDKTLEKAQRLAEGKGKEIEFVRNESKRGKLEILYEVIGKCDPHEIIALIEGKDWLSHENVFDHLNCVYANPNIWMTYSRAISHPQYKKVSGKKLSEKSFRENQKEELTPLVTFYAGFFHAIKLQDYLYNGAFIDEKINLAIQLPLLEMGIDHVFFVDELSYVINLANKEVDHKLHLQKMAEVESHLRSLPSYPNRSQLKLTANPHPLHRYTTDLILFSEDSPLQLYACLESLFAKGRDMNEIYVLYKGGDHEFQRAYLNLQNEFHKVHFLNVCDYPGHDYASLIQKVFANRHHASPYVVIGEDRFILEEEVCFHQCITALEKAHANHFFLSLEEERGENLPKAIPVAEGIYAYQLGDKGALHPFTFALCRKSLFENLEDSSDLPSFKKLWQKKLSPLAVALFYEEKKTFPIKFDQEISYAQKKDWGYKFIEGFKIDISSLACELEEVGKGELPLIKREKHRLVNP